MTTRGRIATALALTIALGTLLVGVVGLLALIGERTTVNQEDIGAFGVATALLALAFLWGALAVLVHEILAVRDDRRARGTTVPAFLGGLLAVTTLAFLVLLYRGTYYTLLLAGRPEAAEALTDPFVVAAINGLVLIFAVANLALVAIAPVRALIRATAARWRAQRATGKGDE
jgi:hypothetical protein